MTPFEQHGLDHLSASSINLFAAQPSLWCMQKLLGHKGTYGAAAQRGLAIEDGVSAGLFDPELPVAEAQKIGLETFDRRMALSADPQRENQRKAIEPSIAMALTELRQYGVPERPPEGKHQHKIEVHLEGVPVPIIGYLDWIFPEHNIIMDLKTQLCLASKISEPHARQGAIYRAAHGNAQVRFAYTTPKKIGVYVLEDVEHYLGEVRAIAQAMTNLLSLSDDPEKLTRSIAPDYTSFYWNSERTRSAGREVWGF